MFGQVTVGSLVADVVRSLGVPCDAMIGLSLGESAGLFAVRAWRGRDEMYRRMRTSSLFVSDLAPPFDAARMYWGVPPGEPADWASGVIAAGPDDVTAALRPGLRAYLLIVNTPAECVIGGRPDDVRKLAEAVGRPFFPLSGVTLAHCEVGKPVEIPYHRLHTLPVTPPKGVTVFSGAWGRGYRVTEQTAGRDDRRPRGGRDRLPLRGAGVRRGRAGVVVHPDDRRDPRRPAAPRPGGPRGEAGRRVPTPAARGKPGRGAGAGRSRLALRRRDALRRPPHSGPRVAGGIGDPGRRPTGRVAGGAGRTRSGARARSRGRG